MSVAPSTEPGYIVKSLLRVAQNVAPQADTDILATEEPLEIRLRWHEKGVQRQQAISITMRTPGDDEELAAGFLLSEGIIQTRQQIAHIGPCGRAAHPDGPINTVRVTLTPAAQVDLKRLQRNFYTTSSCGVCGKSSLDALQTVAPKLPDVTKPMFSAQIIHGLPDALRTAQAVFERTGGLHAAGLFDMQGHLIAVREDVGRHNAVDKLIGAQLLADNLPLSDKILQVSGRASFELVQKALVAGIPVMSAVGAPSSLAVALAQEYGMTLLGFVRAGRFNVYCGAARLGLLGS